MGRLTLNVLSFAQFEREVTGERIRDKIAASKQKGMWMGGNVPLGYDASGRMLVLDDGFSWQGTHYRSLSAIARKITGTAWSGPLFFGLRPNRSVTRPPAQGPVPVDPPMKAHNAAG